jgi:hypothetical protein
MNRRVEKKVTWTQAKGQRANESSPLQAQKPTFEQPQGTSHFRPWESGSEESNDSRKSVVEQGLVTRGASIIASKPDDEAPLCVPISTDWTNPALCRFFKDYSYVVEANEVKVSPGYLNHL